jgi:SAM-dependent methyltransferase
VHRRRLVGEWLLPHRPRTILDAGCGAGHMLAALRERFPDGSFTGVDQAARTVEENRAHLPWARWEQLDLDRAHLDERFDAVVCSEVLEHVADDEAALTHLAAMTGRHLMITVPTGPLLPLEAGFGHLRHYRLEPFCRAVEKRGLRVVRAQAWGFPWMNLFKRAANLRPQATMDGFGAGAWSLPKKAIGAALTGLFYFNLPVRGPQLLVLAER